LTTFILSVLESLPSSSRTPRISTQYPEISAFSNLFVDLVWTVDAELDELVADAKTVTAAAETSTSNASGPSDDTKAQSASLVAAQGKANITKETAEKDKDRLVEVVKRLAVRRYWFAPNHIDLTSRSACQGSRP
jgi:THO complex subunit 2